MTASYVQRFAHLNANKNRRHWTAETTHRAPHKPLLLLAVIDLFAQGSLNANLIQLDTELVELFGLYWGRVRPPSQRGHVAYPFYYLQSEGFWHLLPRPGQEAALAAYRPNAGLQSLQELILGARLDDDLHGLLQTAESRDLLRTTLVETYFSPDVQPDLLAQAAINVEAFHYSQELLSQARTRTLKETPTPAEQPRTPARDQGFRRAVVTAYDHRCALCGIRMLTADGHTAVAAAHIVPWRVSYNDDPRNGIALCHLCHWTFDEGLVTVNGRYVVLTSPQMASTPNVPGHLVTLNDRHMLGPAERPLWPDVEALSWHGREIFRRR